MADIKSPEPRRSTDLRRRIKDIWVDWDEHIRSWKRLVLEGEMLIAAIANSRLSAPDGAEEDVVSSCNNQLKSEVANIHKDQSLNELQQFCNQLVTVLESMRKLVEKMEQLTTELGAAVELGRYQRQNLTAAASSEMLFEACDTQTFYESSSTLSSQYRKELQVKETIVENVALTNERNLFMRYKLTWRCEPYILTSNDSLLEANLVATGLRKS